jgi:3-carboxy-cis,cis-muconate cycloisomerase
MRANLDATGGLIMAEAVAMALAEKLGKAEAHHLVEAASKKAVAEKKALRDVLAKEPKVMAHLSPEKVKKLFEPMAYQGVSQALIDRLLASIDTE